MRRTRTPIAVRLALFVLICLSLATPVSSTPAWGQGKHAAASLAPNELATASARAAAVHDVGPKAGQHSGQPHTRSWIIQVVDSSGDVGQYSSLALDPGDLPHIAYLDNAAGDLKYAYRLGAAWISQTVAQEGSVGLYASLALDTADQPHVSYLDDTWNDLMYVHLSGTLWLSETVDPDIERYTSLALDPDDRPRIAYFGDYDDLYYAHYEGSSWTIEGVDRAGRVGLYTSLALDAAGRPHISYHHADLLDLRYAYFDGSSWVTATVDSGGDVGLYTSLALDAAGRPHISYYDADDKDLKSAYHDGSSWISATVDSAGNVGLYTSLALDAAGRPHISYYDADNKDLKYAYHDGSSWISETVDSAGDVGLYTSLVLDAAGRPHISYYDAEGKALKYAYVCTPVEEVVLSGPSLPPVGEMVVYTATVLPLTATLPITTSWGSGAVVTATFSWTEPGLYTLTVTATNPCGQAEGQFVVRVCQPVEGVQVSGPIDRLVGETGHYTAGYTPPAATPPVTLTWDNGTVGPSAAYSWTLPGRYSLTVTATNPCGEVQGRFAVTVCQPVQGLELSGPLVLPLGETAHYTATYAPPTATVPVTVTWDNGTIGSSAAYSWTVAGTYGVTATAGNPCGGISGTLTVTVCPPIQGAGFTWLPVTPTANERVTFTGTATGSLPISFSWDLGGVIKTGQVVTHVYTASATYAVTMTAANACYAVTVSRTLSVVALPHMVYLPLVIKHWDACFLGPLGFWEIEDNDSFEQANGLLCFDHDYYAYPDDPDDYFAFVAGEGTAVVEMWNYVPEDYGQLLLYDESYQMVGWDPDPSDGWRIVAGTTPGTYYVRIYTADAFSSTAPYTLRTTFTGP